jgi:hypothetical protein
MLIVVNDFTASREKKPPIELDRNVMFSGMSFMYWASLATVF